MTPTITNQLLTTIFFVVGILLTPLFFIALDFWAGIRKAHARGDRIASNKMQRTIAKLSRYYNAILAMLVLDCIQIAGFVYLHIFNNWNLYTFPFATLISVIFVAAIEIKSITEPASAKESRERKEVSSLLLHILEHRGDAKEIADAISDYLNGTKY